MDKDKLQKILDLHREWSESNCKKGKKADLTGAYLRGADLTGAYLRGADLTGADLTRADLTGAYLTRADLTRADLTGAYLRGADLTGADLTRADLTGADLYDTIIISFQLTKWFSFYHQSEKYEDGDYLKIGCIGMSLDKWLEKEKYKEIGQENDYTEKEIEQHYQMMLFIKNHIKEDAE